MKQIPIIVISTLALLGTQPLCAAITIANTGSSVLTDVGASAQVMETTVQNISFNAFGAADAIIVALSSESNALGGQVTISYAGFALTPVIDHTGSNIPSIWYLNLGATTYAGGAATLALDMTAVDTVNGYGLGIVSVNAGGNDIAVHASNTANASSVGLTTTVDETFVMAGYRANTNENSTATANSPLTQLYGQQIGSSIGSSGYRLNVPVGSSSYSFTSTGDTLRSSAVAFVAVPEPSSAVLLVSTGLLLIMRRRR